MAQIPLDENPNQRQGAQYATMPPPAVCCPPDAAPYLAPEHEAMGTIMDANGVVEMYQAQIKGAPSTGIIICADVWGWNGGRTRAIADALSDTGHVVVVPKLLTPPKEGGTDGDALSPTSQFDLEWVKQFPWDVQKPKLAAVVEYLKGQGVTKVGVLGFCYGGHPCCWMSAEWPDVVACGVVCHPSMQLEQFAFGGDFLGLVKSVKAPFLIAPAGQGDLPMYAPESEFATALAASTKGSECVIKPYAEMSHGWVPRGDLADAAVARDVELVMEDVFSFFAKYL